MIYNPQRAAPHLHVSRGGYECDAPLLKHGRLGVTADNRAVLRHAGRLNRVAGPRVALGQALGWSYECAVYLGLTRAA